MKALFLLLAPLSALAAEPARPSCPLNLQLSASEQTQFVRFHGNLAGLRRAYGQADFESRLQALVEKQWPQVRLDQVTPLFFERTQALVDRARMNQAVAKTIGLDHADFQDFDSLVHSVLVHQNIYGHVDTFEQRTKKLLVSISRSRQGSDWQMNNAEALLRVTQLSIQLMRWRALNGAILDEEASAHAKTVAILGIGLAGGSVIVATTVLAAPFVAGAGAATAGLSANPVVAGLLVKTAEVAAGATLGFVGAPATLVTQGAYHALTESAKQSANGATSFSCELSRQMADWKAKAGGELIGSALYGAAVGAGGGALTFHPAAAKALLYATGLGVGVAQSFAMYKAGRATYESYAHYKLAQEAELAGNFALARSHLIQARDLAQQAGKEGLESVIVGVLANEVAGNFRRALREGDTAIRQLWAASADTIPSAAASLQEAINSAREGH